MAKITALSLLSYRQFATVLEPENWQRMYNSQADESALQALMQISTTTVCEVGEQLVGVIFLVSSGHATDIYPADWAYIRRLGVDPAFRGKGIGHQLTVMAIEQARQNGEKTIGLHTSTMMPDARHIYEKLGFSLMRELDPILGQQYWLYSMPL
ncbi:GNAT family N-acetyltransferase [Chitinophaga nivalis]|uniref:GNAT family N-acetyltransferase n=1 Tax=Chitinophaga nivalis TaxID=2991709 RepID=A0ABT3IVS4_9BACT|nr:GNAT family N-acetyltransferase [Chitinophaga nivalis]MCW3462260.1 GNAT family N-acetyltransferase [Chitinophaga nivalis]MCW3488048.1 GNAT family N-acetyltransferase [Chitinophaga nivalis]